MQNRDSQDLLQAELTKRLREALVLKDWTRLEHWARQWIILLPGNPSGFKWLARATLAQNKIAKAAYAYGRLLDVDPENAEAKKFFAQYPSSVAQVSPISSPKPLAGEPKSASELPDLSSPDLAPLLNPDQRLRLANIELETARVYEEMQLYSEAAERYRASNHWSPSQAAILGASRALHRAHKGHEATRYLREQLYHYPDWADGRALLGRILFELGHLAEAQREWQLVLRVDPNHGEALTLLRELMARC